ncbi:MAG: T9SS type A sorting domain-containing protein [Saprospiraceae bacterium]|nr:T9SS type A sorting domain-containing protein [Saprospiraceae bacterium]
MKPVLAIVFQLLLLISLSAQGNRVFSGGELINYSIVDISAIDGIAWSTERIALPGYFSVVDTATYIGCSDTANIDGYIKKYGNNNFIFPVGSGNDLRTLEISAPISKTETYATAWILGNPSFTLDPTAPNEGTHSVLLVSAPIVSVSTIGQWDWQVGAFENLGTGTTGTGEGLTITASIPDMTSFAEKNNLRLVGWDGSSWIDLSNSATANGNIENSTLIGTMKMGITAIAIGSIELSLFIKLENFAATSINCNTIITWSTLEENNTESFIVEQSFDAIDFHSIATLIATGSMNGTNNYKISISQPSGIVFYRLKIINKDGTSSYSKIILIQNNCNEKDYMIVYPNPVSAYEKINLRFETYYRGNADLVIFNTLGQRILTQPILVNGGINLISLKLEELTAAVYFIIVLSENGKQIGSTQKFIRQ